MLNNLGRYEIRNILGRGGMATVYHAYDRTFGREVALKVISPKFLQDEGVRTRFQREAQIVARLEHQAIVPLYDVGEAQGSPFMVMQLMSGGSLQEKLKQGPLTLQETYRIADRIAQALDAAHAQNIVHRDLKPANVLFDRWGEAYVTDFGIAKLLSADETQITKAGDVVGTPYYMSPEQVKGEYKLDGRTDVYALGTMVFEMLSGRPPFLGASATAVAFKHVTEPVPDVSSVKGDLPQGVQNCVAKAMAKLPEDRFQHASRFSEALGNLVIHTGAPIANAAQSASLASGPDTGSQNVGFEKVATVQSTGRTKASVTSAIIVGIAMLLLALVVGGALLWFMFNRQQDSTLVIGPTSTQARAPEIVAQPAATATERFLQAEPTVTPTVPVLPSATIEPPLPTPVASATLAQVVVEPLTVLSSTQYQLDPVPVLFNGAPLDQTNASTIDLLASVGQGVAIDFRNARNGNRSVIATTMGFLLLENSNLTVESFVPTETRPFSAAISDDGEQVAVGLINGEVWLYVGFETGQITERLLGKQNGRIVGLAFSPDGLTIAAGSATGQILLYDLSGSISAIELNGHAGLVRALAFSQDSRSLASGAQDKEVLIWDIGNRRIVHRFEGHTRPIESLAFNDDDTVLASASGDQTVRLWSVDEGVLLHTLQGHVREVVDVDFGLGGTVLISSSLDRTVRIWNTNDATLLHTFTVSGQGVLAAEVDVTGTKAMVLSADGNVTLWSLSSFEFEAMNTVASVPISNMTFLDPSTIIFGAVGQLNWWRVNEGLWQQLWVNFGQISSLVVAHQSNAIFLSTLDGYVIRWELDVGGPGRILLAYDTLISAIDLSESDDYLVVGTARGDVELWNGIVTEQAYTMDVHVSAVTSLAFAPDESIFASGGADGAILFWNRDDGALVRRLTGHTAAIQSLAFSADGQLLSSASEDGTIRLWESDTGLLRTLIAVEGGAVNDVEFSPNGQLLVSAGADSVVRIWQVESGELLLELAGHRDEVTGVAFAPDGRSFATSSADGTIRLWGFR